MEAVTKPSPAESAPEDERILVNPADIIDLEELTAEEREAVEKTSDESETENPSREQYTKIGISVLGGIVGFVAGAYLNNFVMNKILSSATTAPTASTLLGYTAVLFVVELIVGGFLLLHAMKHGGKTSEFVDGFGLGLIIAGAGAVVSQYLVNSGQVNPILPAVNFAGKPLVPANRVVAT